MSLRCGAATRAACASIFFPATRTIPRATRSTGRPRAAGGGGASADGGGEDEFRFALSDDEFIDLFLEDLELPDLAKRQVMGEKKDHPRRAGFRSSGPPSMISVPRTMRNSLSRRIALKRPKPEEIAELEAQLKELEESGGGEDEILAIRTELARQAKRSRVDPVHRSRRCALPPLRDRSRSLSRRRSCSASWMCPAPWTST